MKSQVVVLATLLIPNLQLLPAVELAFKAGYLLLPVDVGDVLYFLTLSVFQAV